MTVFSFMLFYFSISENTSALKKCEELIYILQETSPRITYVLSEMVKDFQKIKPSLEEICLYVFRQALNNAYKFIFCQFKRKNDIHDGSEIFDYLKNILAELSSMKKDMSCELHQTILCFESELNW